MLERIAVAVAIALLGWLEKRGVSVIALSCDRKDGAARAIAEGGAYDLRGMTTYSYLPPGWVTRLAASTGHSRASNADSCGLGCVAISTSRHCRADTQRSEVLRPQVQRFNTTRPQSCRVVRVRSKRNPHLSVVSEAAI